MAPSVPAMAALATGFMSGLGRRGRRNGRFASVWTDFAQDTIVNPVLVPPLLRVDLNAGDHHAEVNVVAKRHAGGSADADLLLFRNVIAHFDENAAHVAVKALQRIAVVDNDAVSVKAETVGVDHASGVGGLHRRIHGLREIVAEMHLLIHFAPVVNVAAAIGEKRFASAFDGNERSGPENFLFGIVAQIVNRLSVRFAQLAVEFEKTVEE